MSFDPSKFSNVEVDCAVASIGQQLTFCNVQEDQIAIAIIGNGSTALSSGLAANIELTVADPVTAGITTLDGEVFGLGNASGEEDLPLDLVTVYDGSIAITSNDPQVLVLQPGPAEGKDTYFGIESVGGQEGRPDAEEIRIGGWGDIWNTFIQFDLSGAPAAESINSAHLHLYNRLTTNSNNGKLFRVAEPWAEADPSSTSSPGVVDYGMAYQLVPNEDWWVVDVTDVVKDWLDGTHTNYGFKISGQFTNNNHVKEFRSSDYLANPEQRPKLVIEYQ